MLCIGGLVGGMMTLPTEYTGQSPTVIAAAFGLVVGYAMRRGVPVLPGMSLLIRLVYGAPLGKWLGWRR
jgi:hypothetical protein